MQEIRKYKSIREKFLPFCLPSIGQEEIQEVVTTLRSGWLTMGPKVKKFEENFAKYAEATYAVAVSSCTAALHLALVACDIKAGDEVITTPYTFAATAEAILYVGAKPIFVDIDKNTFNINVEKIEANITERTKAIIPVHIAGQPCDMDKIVQIARKYKLWIIEDAAHALGARYKGRKIGSIGHVTCFSFYPTKNITTGEGGMLTTNDAKIAQRVNTLRLHGISRDAWKRYTQYGSWHYEVIEVGFKYNMTDVQAAIGLHQLKKLGEFQKIREKYAKMYNDGFADLPEIVAPYVKKDVKHAWHLYIIKIRPELLKINRNEFISKLIAENIGVSVHFIPLHLHPYYKKTYDFKNGDFPNAEYVYERVISLPLYPGMTMHDIEDVIYAVRKVVTTYRK